MKTASALIFLVSSWALAQTVDVKGVETGSQDSTTIEIRKGEKAKTNLEWEVHDGTSEIAGDPQSGTKEARAAWRRACDEWKKDFRSDNKENRIINVTCGTPTCGGDATNKTCTSTASYKVKTKIN